MIIIGYILLFFPSLKICWIKNDLNYSIMFQGIIWAMLSSVPYIFILEWESFTIKKLNYDNK